MKKNIWSLFCFCEKKDDKQLESQIKSSIKSKKITTNLTNAYLTSATFRSVSSVHFQTLIMNRLRYKYYNKWITILNNRNVQSHDQEESKWNSTMNANSSAHTLPHDKIIKSPFNKNNVAVIKNNQNSNKYFITRACRIGTVVPK